MRGIDFAGQWLCPLAEHALWWPAERALIVADLHLEKASALAATGQMLPPYDSIDTVNRLVGLARQYDARQIFALGDSFHDKAGPERLPPAARAALHHLAQHVAFVWVEGNHDANAAITDHLPGVLCGDMVVGTLNLVHIARETPPDAGRGEISGHYHPKIRVRHRGQHIARPCFVLSERQMILPAFGTLTGGLDAASAAMAHLGPREALIPVGSALHRLPIGAVRNGQRHYGRNAAVLAK